MSDVRNVRFIEPLVIMSGGVGTNFAGTNVSATLNTNGISMSVGGGGAGDGWNQLQFSGSTANSTQPVLFSNANGVSFGLNGSTVTASHNGLTTAAQSNHTHSQYGGTGFTGTNASGTINSNGLQLSIAAGGGGADGFNIVSLGTVGTTGTAWSTQSGTVAINGGGIVTVSQNNSNQIVINAPAQTDLTNHAHAYSNATTAVSSRVIQIAAGTGTLSGNLTITGSNGISVANVGNEIRVSLLDSHHIDAMAFAGNNAGTAFSQMTSGTVTLNFGGFISGSQAGNGLTITSPDLTNLTGHLHSQYASTTHSHGISGSNGGMSFGASLSVVGLGAAQVYTTAGNSFVISAPAQSIQTQNSVLINGGSGAFTLAGTTTAGTGVGLTVNSNGINASVVTNYSTGYSAKAESTHSHGNPTLALTNLTGTTASASNGFTISLSAAAPGGGAADGWNPIAAGGSTANSTQSVVFGNANGVSFSLNGSTVTASYNSTQFAGLGTSATNASITMNSNGLAISVAAPGAAAENNNINLAGNTAGNTTASGSTIQWIGGNNVTLSGTNGSQIQINAEGVQWNLVGANTAGTTSSNLSAGLILLSGGPNITLSGSSNTIVVSAAAGGAAGTVGGWEIFEFANNTAWSSQGQNTLYAQKFQPAVNYSFNNIERYASVNIVTSTNSQAVSETVRYGLYSLDTNNSYQLIASSSMAISASLNSNTAMGISINCGALSHTSTSGGTNLASLYNAFRHLYFPFTSTVTAGGNYAIGFLHSTASAIGTNPWRMSQMVLTNFNNLTIGKIFATAGVATHTTNVGDNAMMVFATTTNAMPSAFAKSQVTNAVSQARMYLQLDA